MKRIALVTSLLLTCFGVYAQTSEIDSLIQNLGNYKTNDSLRAQLFLDVAVKLRKIDPNKARTYYDTASHVAEQANEGVIHVKANNGLAICYGMLGSYPEAISSFHKTIELSKKYNQPGRIADGYNGLGIVYKRLGDYPQAMEYYSKALPLYDSIKDYRGLGAAYENLGVLHDLMKEPDKALKQYEKALAIYKEQKETLMISLARDNMAILLMDQNKFDDALKILLENRRIYDSLQRHPNSIATNVNIANILIKRGQLKEAKELSLTNLDKAKRYEIKQEQTNIYNNLVEIALTEKKYDLALLYVKEHERLAKELQSTEFIKLSYALYARLYESKGDYEKSLESYKQFKAWSDTLFNEEQTRAFKAQEVKVEVLEKNKQLAEQNLRVNFLQDKVAQETRIRWLLIFASSMLLIVAILSYQKFAERKRVSEILAAKNDQISRQKLQIEAINYQLENRMLRAQINPHFIFNSLGSIQHFITSDDKSAALKYLTKFSNLLRKVLESSISGNVLLHEEIELVSMYLQLEALRFNGNFTYDIHIDNSLDTYSVEMPTMILQPLIENAILHGLLTKESDRKLDLLFSLKNQSIEIKVLDNGIGRSAAQKRQENKYRANPSRGISVTEQRLESLKEKHGWQITMQYEDMVHTDGTPAGTCVTLNVPIDSK